MKTTQSQTIMEWIGLVAQNLMGRKHFCDRMISKWSWVSIWTVIFISRKITICISNDVSSYSWEIQTAPLLRFYILTVHATGSEDISTPFNKWHKHGLTHKSNKASANVIMSHGRTVRMQFNWVGLYFYKCFYFCLLLFFCMMICCCFYFY